jgi:hypothetical protein
MSVKDTSLETFYDIKSSLGDRQKVVLETIQHAKRPVNNQEIANFLHRQINTITPRTNELVELGKVELAFKAVYPTTNRRVCYWKAKNELNVQDEPENI